MLTTRLFLAQRLSALLLAPLVLIHLAMIIYAVQGGLDSSEILSRTQGSLFWAMLYGLFVLAVAVHGAIGIRVIAYEWLHLRGTMLGVISWLLFGLLLALGLQAVLALVSQ